MYVDSFYFAYVSRFTALAKQKKLVHIAIYSILFIWHSVASRGGKVGRCCGEGCWWGDLVGVGVGKVGLCVVGGRWARVSGAGKDWGVVGKRCVGRGVICAWVGGCVVG